MNKKKSEVKLKKEGKARENSNGKASTKERIKRRIFRNRGWKLRFSEHFIEINEYPYIIPKKNLTKKISKENSNILKTNQSNDSKISEKSDNLKKNQKKIDILLEKLPVDGAIIEGVNGASMKVKQIFGTKSDNWRLERINLLLKCSECNKDTEFKLSRKSVEVGLENNGFHYKYCGHCKEPYMFFTIRYDLRWLISDPCESKSKITIEDRYSYRKKKYFCSICKKHHFRGRIFEEHLNYKKEEGILNEVNSNSFNLASSVSALVSKGFVPELIDDWCSQERIVNEVLHSSEKRRLRKIHYKLLNKLELFPEEILILKRIREKSEKYFHQIVKDNCEKIHPEVPIKFNIPLPKIISFSLIRDNLPQIKFNSLQFANKLKEFAEHLEAVKSENKKLYERMREEALRKKKARRKNEKFKRIKCEKKLLLIEKNLDYKLNKGFKEQNWKFRKLKPEVVNNYRSFFRSISDEINNTIRFANRKLVVDEIVKFILCELHYLFNFRRDEDYIRSLQEYFVFLDKYFIDGFLRLYNYSNYEIFAIITNLKCELLDQIKKFTKKEISQEEREFEVSEQDIARFYEEEGVNLGLYQRKNNKYAQEMLKSASISVQAGQDLTREQWIFLEGAKIRTEYPGNYNNKAKNDKTSAKSNDIELDGCELILLDQGNKSSLSGDIGQATNLIISDSSSIPQNKKIKKKDKTILNFSQNFPSHNLAGVKALSKRMNTRVKYSLFYDIKNSLQETEKFSNNIKTAAADNKEEEFYEKETRKAKRKERQLRKKGRLFKKLYSDLEREAYKARIEFHEQFDNDASKYDKTEFYIERFQKFNNLCNNNFRIERIVNFNDQTELIDFVLHTEKYRKKYRAQLKKIREEIKKVHELITKDGSKNKKIMKNSNYKKIIASILRSDDFSIELNENYLPGKINRKIFLNKVQSYKNLFYILKKYYNRDVKIKDFVFNYDDYLILHDSMKSAENIKKAFDKFNNKLIEVKDFGSYVGFRMNFRELIRELEKSVQEEFENKKFGKNVKTAVRNLSTHNPSYNPLKSTISVKKVKSKKRKRKNWAKKDYHPRAVVFGVAVIILIVAMVIGFSINAKSPTIYVEKGDNVKLKYTVRENLGGIDDELDPSERNVLFDDVIWLRVIPLNDADLNESSEGMILGLYEELLGKKVGYNSSEITLSACVDENLDGIDDRTGGKAESYGHPSHQYFNTSLIIKFKVLAIEKKPQEDNEETKESPIRLPLPFSTKERVHFTIGILMALLVVLLVYYAKDQKHPFKSLKRGIAIIFSFIAVSIIFLISAGTFNPFWIWIAFGELVVLILTILVSIRGTLKKGFAPIKKCVRCLRKSSGNLSRTTKSIVALVLILIFTFFFVTSMIIVKSEQTKVKIAVFSSMALIIAALLSSPKKFWDDFRAVKKAFSKGISYGSKIGICIAGILFFAILSIGFTFVINSIEMGILFFLLLGGFVSVFMPSAVSTRNRSDKKRGGFKSYKGKRIKSFWIAYFLVFLAMVLAWFQVNITEERCPIPQFGLVPAEFRRNGISYNMTDVEFHDNFSDLGDVPFNSIFVLKFNLNLATHKKVTFFAELYPPKDESSKRDKEEDQYYKKHIFKSQRYIGPKKNVSVYLKIDLTTVDAPVLPGSYKLKVYYLSKYLFSVSRKSTVHKYRIKITKDKVHFNPSYKSEPLQSTRRGCIYSLENARVAGWDNHFNAYVEDSLGQPVNGKVNLYLTRREGFKPVFKKIDTVDIKDGKISYVSTTRGHYRSYMQGKIEFDGDRSLFYESATHIEDAEVAKDKFVFTASQKDYGDLDKLTYNGTNWADYDQNNFKKTSHLYYFHDFSFGELWWTKNVDAYAGDPVFEFYPGSLNYTKLDIDKTNAYPDGSISAYVESPLLGYLGTQADIATFTYCYQLRNFGSPSDNIYVKLKSQLIRDGEMVHEQFDYNDYYNTPPNQEVWETVNVPLTEYFDEGGRKFAIKISAEFQFQGEYDNDISLRFDYAKLEAFYKPCYYRGFDFENGFNGLASPSEGSSEPYYWDVEHPITVGRDILTYEDYPGIITNNYFDDDYRLDGSWDFYSGIFKTDEYGNPVFIREEEINIPPVWNEIDNNGMSIFDLQSVRPILKVSDNFESKIEDEFTSEGDSDEILEDIRQRYVVPKVVANQEKTIIVFTARYLADDKWKIYFAHANRPNGTYSMPARVYDTGNDENYQLAPSIALSDTDLHIAWMQRNREVHPSGETEWEIMYGRISLSDFTLRSVKSVTAYNPSDLDKTAMMAPEIALTPTANIYNEEGQLIHQDCIVHITYENATYTDLTSGDRNNEDVGYINKYIYYSQLNSTYLNPDFSAPLRVSDYTGNSINYDGNLEVPQIVSQVCYNTTNILENSTDLYVDFGQLSENRVFELRSISIKDSQGLDQQLFASESDFVKQYGADSIKFAENKIVLPDDLQFMDLYDNRFYQYGIGVFAENISVYCLNASIPSNISLVRKIKDIFVSDTPLVFLENAERLNRSSYSIIGDYGSNNLNVSFANNFTKDTYFFVKYSLDNYSLPLNFTVEVSTIKNELAFIFERYINSTNRKVFIDVTNDNFQFQEDILVIGDMSRFGNIKYDHLNQLHVIYSSIINTFVPSQPDDFDILYGASDWMGSCSETGNYTTFYSELLLGTVHADGDIDTEWSISGGSAHWEAIATKDDGIEIMSSTQGSVDSFDMETFDLQGGFFDRIEVCVYGSGFILGTSVVNVKINVGGWTSEKSITLTSTAGWVNVSWDVLNGDQEDLNGLQVLFENDGFPFSVPSIDEAYCKIYWSPQKSSDIHLGSAYAYEDLTTEWSVIYNQDFTHSESISVAEDDVFIFASDVGAVDSFNVETFDLQGKSFDRIEVSLYGAGYGGTCDVDVKINVGGWTSEKRITLPSSTTTFSWINVSWDNLNGDQGDLDGLQMWFEHAGGIGLPCIDLAYCKVYQDRLTPHKLDFKATLNFDYGEAPIYNLSLRYSYFTNIYQEIDFKVYNYDLGQFELLESSNYDSFYVRSYNLNSSHYTENFEILVWFYGHNDSYDFKLHLDVLKVKIDSDVQLKYGVYNTNTGEFSYEKFIVEQYDSSKYDYYKISNVILEKGARDSFFIAYEVHFRESGGSERWKLKYLYSDQDTLYGPFCVVDSNNTQERNLNAYWSNGLFYAFSTNDTNNWAVEFTSSERSDLTTFSSLSADFIPTMYNTDKFQAYTSVYFDVHLNCFQNTFLEQDDRLRFIVVLENKGQEHILLDTGWNDKNLTNWIAGNLNKYYPRYLRYYYNLSLHELTYSEIYNADQKVQEKIYPFELNLYQSISLEEVFTLTFYLVKNGWSLNKSADLDIFQMGLDKIDLSFEIIPINDLNYYAPYQPENFSLFEGTSDWAGSLSEQDNSTIFFSSDSILLGDIYPDGDLVTEWDVVPSETNHWEALTTESDFNFIYPETEGTIDSFNLETFDLQGETFSRVGVWLAGGGFLFGSGGTVDVQINVGGWTPKKRLIFPDSYVWTYVYWDVLSGTQQNLDNLQLRFNSTDSLIALDVAYCSIYGTVSGGIPAVNFTAAITLDDRSDTGDVKLEYSYYTSVPLSDPVDFKVYNYDIGEFELIDNSNRDDSSINLYSLNSSHYSENYQVNVSFYGSNEGGLFSLYLDILKVKIQPYPNKFGVLTKSDKVTPHCKSEFLVSNKVSLEELSFITDPNLKESENNLIDLSIEFDIYALLYEQIQQLIFYSSGQLECEMIVMVEGASNPDLTISNEITYNSWTGYKLESLELKKKWSKNFGTLYYSLDLTDFNVNIYKKDDYFTLSESEQRALFNVFKELYYEGFDEVFVVFDFEVETITSYDQNVKSGINVLFKEIKLQYKWSDNSQYHVFSKSSNPSFFFEKRTKEAYLRLLSDHGIDINGRDDFISFYSISNAYYEAGSDGDYQYYLPSIIRQINKTTPAEYLTLINTNIADCVGIYDAFDNLYIDGQDDLKGKAGIISPNLYENETCSYSLRSIINLYPFYNYQNGTDLEKSFEEFKSELLKIKLEIYNQYNEKILSKYSNKIFKIADLDIGDFVYATNSEGERYYYTENPLKVYIYGQDILTSTDYIYLELTAEFLDDFYITNRRDELFKNQWGIFVDSWKNEFIVNKVSPEFIVPDPQSSEEVISGVYNVIVKALGNNYEWAALYYNYKNMGEHNGYDLIANVSDFEYKNDFSYFNFTWDTTNLEDDNIYELMIVIQDNIGLKGNTTLTNLTIINAYPDVTCLAYEMDSEGTWNTIQDGQAVEGYVKLITQNNDPSIPLTKVSYYFNNEPPTEQNRNNWTKIIDLSSEELNFEYVLHSDSIPNGSWYLISEAYNGGPHSNFSGFVNQIVFDHFSDAIQVNDVVGPQNTVSLEISDVLESQIKLASFKAKAEGGVGNWMYLNNDTSAPFSTTFVNLPWSDTTVFDIFIHLQIMNTYIGACYLNLTRKGLTLDRDGPVLEIVENPNSVLYKIWQANGAWIADNTFDGIIDGFVNSSDQDFTSYKIEYNYGKGWKYDSKLYDAEEELRWNVKYVPDGVINFTIIGYDSFNNDKCSHPLELAFINDQNYYSDYSDFKIEGYSFDRVYNIFEPTHFKIFPIAQDIEQLNLTCANIIYPFTKKSDDIRGLYFENWIQFDPSDFDLENQNVDTQILAIKASDLKSQELEFNIPYTVALALDTSLNINNLSIEVEVNIKSEEISDDDDWDYLGISKYIGSYVNDYTFDIEFDGTYWWILEGISTIHKFYANWTYIASFQERPSYQTYSDFEIRSIFYDETYWWAYAWHGGYGLFRAFKYASDWEYTGESYGLISTFSPMGNLFFNGTHWFQCGNLYNPGIAIFDSSWNYLSSFTLDQFNNPLHAYPSDIYFDGIFWWALDGSDRNKVYKYAPDGQSWSYTGVSYDLDTSTHKFFYDGFNTWITGDGGEGNNGFVYKYGYGKFFPYEEFIFSNSSNIYVDISCDYSNVHGIPYFNKRPKIKFSGLVYGNEYEFELKPNFNATINIANLSVQTSRSITGQKLLKIDSVPGGTCEITRIHIDSNNNGTFDTILGLDKFFYYFSVYGEERRLFIQFSDLFIEYDFYDVKIEYTFSSYTPNYPFVFKLDVGELVSDVYNVEVSMHELYSTTLTKTFNGINIDHDGPTTVPLFNNFASFNGTSGAVSFEVEDPNGVDSVNLFIGEGWDPVGKSGVPATNDMIHLENGNILIVGDGKLWRTNSSNPTDWSLCFSGIEGLSISRFADNGSGVVYVSYYGGSYFYIKKSSDYGETWIDLPYDNDLPDVVGDLVIINGVLTAICYKGGWGTDYIRVYQYQGTTPSWVLKDEEEVVISWFLFYPALVQGFVADNDVYYFVLNGGVPTFFKYQQSTAKITKIAVIDLDVENTLNCAPLIVNSEVDFDDSSNTGIAYYFGLDLFSDTQETVIFKTTDGGNTWIEYTDWAISESFEVYIVPNEYLHLDKKWVISISQYGGIFGSAFSFPEIDYAYENAQYYDDLSDTFIEVNAPILAEISDNYIFQGIIEDGTFFVIDYDLTDTNVFRYREQRKFNGTTEVDGIKWTFKFNEANLTGLENLIVIANDTFGYESIFDSCVINFDFLPLKFYPELLLDGYLFRGGGLIHVKNSTGPLFNKPIKSMRIYTNSSVDFGWYYPSSDVSLTQFLGVVYANGDIDNEWSEMPLGIDHWEAIGESEDSAYISSNIAGKIDSFDMETLDLQGMRVSKIELWVYGSSTLEFYPSSIDAKINLGGWSSERRISVSHSDSYWHYTSWSDLSGSQTDLDNLQIWFEVAEGNPKIDVACCKVYAFDTSAHNYIVDSARIADGEHLLYFEGYDAADNPFKVSYPIYVDNTAPSINSITINENTLEEEIYFNDNVDLSLVLDDTSGITSVKMRVFKILGDPAIYELDGQNKEWSSIYIRRLSSNPEVKYYLAPNRTTYSFTDGWYDGSDYIYENVINWSSGNIPFI
ncbi:MAG: hypothetical protein ACFFAN_01445, partial [Promethearchaeota archaeon]